MENDNSFIARLESEAHELNGKLKKLHAFMLSEKFDALTMANRVLLNMQAKAMGDSLEVLITRYELLTGKQFGESVAL